MTYDINTIYTKYKQLTKKQRQQLLAALQSQGINIVKIEAYEYTVSIRSTPYCISQKNIVPLHGGIIFLILRQEYAI